MVAASTPRVATLLPYAELVGDAGAERLWKGQNLLLDPLQGLAQMAFAGKQVPVGVGVALMPLRHPFDTASRVRSLAIATRSPVVLGLGPGPRPFQQALLGAPYARPLQACREYLEMVRKLLQGGWIRERGEYFSCEASIEYVPHPTVHLGLGVLRPGMAELAGEIADAAITWLTPAAYLRDTVVPALRQGADKAGRPMPRLVAMVPVARARPDADPARIAIESNGPHLRGAHYRDMLARAGIEVTDDHPTNGRRLIEGGAFVYGDDEEIAGRLREFQDVGVDEIVINMTGALRVHGLSAVLDDLRSVLTNVELSRE